MKKIIVCALFALIAFSASAQTKTDSVKVSKTELETMYRNSNIFIQNIHVLHLDAILRDKLDSVYKESAILFEQKLKLFTPKQPKK